MNKPVNKKDTVVDEIFGYTISDPFRWLENPDTDEVMGWIKGQNEYTEASLKDSTFDTFSDELVKNFKAKTFSNPCIRKGKYFYTERQPDEDQPAIYVKNGIDGEPVKLIDPNGMNKGNTVTIDFWNPSRDGKYLAYGLSQDGTEMATLYVKNVETQENLGDIIVHCRYSSVIWLPDNSGFFYTRNPRPNTVPKDEEAMHSKVYLHMLGDDPGADVLIFGKNRPKDDMLSIALSIDGTYLAISASQSWTKNDVFIFNTKDKTTTPLIKDLDAKFHLMFSYEKVFIFTNYKANNYRILALSLDSIFTPIEEWEELIPERSYLLADISLTKDKILIEYLENVCSKIVEFDFDGNEKGEIPLPSYSSTAGISTNREENEFFYGVTSFVFPRIIYRYDPVLRVYGEYARFDNPINPDDYVVKQEWCKSTDGIKIPFFVIHKKGLEKNGLNPTVLYGYGGFNYSLSPSFNKSWLPWLERNGIYVIANIRGGGEFGSAWHKDALKEKRQNSFDDFICTAEYLIDQKYTNKEQLGISGGSNGGLLVAAVAVQRPDLFKAVCSMVPLTDMVRFSKFGMAMRWTNEYGNPEVKEELENILKWSPYHTVKGNIEYPNFLFTTGIKDSRVDPLHARKMGALLQSTNKINKVFILTEMDAGHGAGKPISKYVETQGFVLSFFARCLGLDVVAK